MVRNAAMFFSSFARIFSPVPVPRGRGFRAEIFTHPVFHKNLSFSTEINIIEDLLITQVVKIRDPFL